MSNFVSYLRVSTTRQGISGLGLEAQRTAVSNLIGAATLLTEYVEIESGRKCARPQLALALAEAKARGATLIVAKLDRLSRNARFLLGIVESGADVMFCDLPTLRVDAVGKFILTQMAAVAELESGLTSERTRLAMAEAKARGVIFGQTQPLAVAARVNRAKAAAKELLPTITAIQSEGAKSFQCIADALNARGVSAPKGGQWHKGAVARTLALAA